MTQPMSDEVRELLGELQVEVGQVSSLLTTVARGLDEAEATDAIEPIARLLNRMADRMDDIPGFVPGRQGAS